MDIKELVVKTFIDEVALPRHKFTLEDDLTKDLKIDSDDLSAFVMALEKKMNLDIPHNEWLNVYTLQGVIELVSKYHNKKGS